MMSIEYVKVQKCKVCGCLATPHPVPDQSGNPSVMYFCGTCNRWFSKDQVEWVKVICGKLQSF